jgi:hypothetical protein
LRCEPRLPLMVIHILKIAESQKQAS